MRRLFAFALSSIQSYITVDIAGVGKRKVMQKGAFAYKADEKCISHKNSLQRFNINACKMSLNQLKNISLYKDGMILCCLIHLFLIRGPFTASSDVSKATYRPLVTFPVYSDLGVAM